MWPLCNVSVLQRSCDFQPLPGRSGRKRSAGKSQAPALHREPAAARGPGRKAARILPKSADGLQPHRRQQARGKPKSFPSLSPTTRGKALEFEYGWVHWDRLIATSDTFGFVKVSSGLFYLCFKLPLHMSERSRECKGSSRQRWEMESRE